MAIATGTAAAIAAITSAAAQTGGAAMASRANNRATDAQARAAREAMAYQEKREWQARSDARSQYDNYMRTTYGDKYQPTTTAPAAAAPVPTGLPGAGFGGTPMPGTGAPAVVAPLPTAAPVAAPPLAGTPTAAPQSLADLGPWSAGNFNRYLGRR